MLYQLSYFRTPAPNRTDPDRNYKLVGEKGFEPPWVAPPDPKSGASTSSATRPLTELSRDSAYILPDFPGFASLVGQEGLEPPTR